MSDLENALRKKIKILSDHVWERRADNPDVEAWLDQFSHSSDAASDEKIQMLFLLSNFVYFGVREVRELLKCVYRDHFRYKIIEAIRRENQNTLDCALIRRLFMEELDRTRFMGVGNPSESGCHLLYYYRQENNLPKTLFMHHFEIFSRDKSGVLGVRNEDIKHYVFIDDLCGSGQQVSSYSQELIGPLRDLDPGARVHYYVLFAMSSGIEFVRSLGIFDEVSAVIEFDDSFKTFSPDSRYYKNEESPISRVAASEIAERYGRSLFPDHPLGYADCQLLLGFSHNTPDNTIPIFWANKDQDGRSWHPIFRRYNKDYGWGL